MADQNDNNPDNNADQDPNAEQFWKLADSFINLANQHYESDGDGKIGYAMLYAAARFNAFIVATTAGDKKDLAEETEQATEFFTEQYRKMFAENIEDYLENFDKYV